MEMKLDCSACKSSKSMIATKISKFSTILRIIGYIIVTPSVIGIIIAAIMFLATGQATNEVISSAKSTGSHVGASIGATIGYGLSLFVGGSSLVGGVLGWLLLMKKKVYKCLTCGFILDRA
jgi:hypothetical protein